ncbi:hypothetical protein JGI9_01590 [Candidatus Kryptonium thompsonii]|nr:hypothetical protein JGI9_01590 [Candidatus Kryptonium thompsoni]
MRKVAYVFLASLILLSSAIPQQKLSDKEKALQILRGLTSREREEQRKTEHKIISDYIQHGYGISLSKSEDLRSTQVQAELPPYIAKDTWLSERYKKLKSLSESEVKEFYRRLDKNLRKTAGEADRKKLVMNGNKITVTIYNYGSLSAPGDRITDVVWNGLGYAYEFGPLIGASVVDTSGKRIHIITDGLLDGGDRSPDGTKRWGWQPLPGYADPNQDKIAHNPDKDLDGDGKPDSWPSSWYDQNLGKYVWPGYLSRDATQADLEAFYVMDDRDNEEFAYFPFENDPSRRGLGVQAQVRVLQWSNPLAEDAIFIVYTITNVSDKNLDSVVFGMWGDPHVGGATDYSDDDSYFIPPYNVPNYPPVDNIPVYARSMVYSWDHDGKGMFGLKPGYFGYKFLESPGNPYDGIDNDGDGMIDESQQDGIDNDGDWNPLVDDVGVDGVPGTGDEGEGDGIPTRGKLLADGSLDPLSPGEPNFEFTDLDESDMIGLTSFNAFIWSTDYVSNDENIWNRLKPGNFSEIVQTADNVFLYGSGYIQLPKGQTRRFSVALLLGEDLNDLLLNAETVQRIYNANYRFYRPPERPRVRAVAGDRRVVLYWDTRAERSFDPLFGRNPLDADDPGYDFEGYVIYRSTDPSFKDVELVTDGRGAKYLRVPLKDAYGRDARFDKVDGWRGYSVVAYPGRGIHYYLGDDVGLVHSYVDSVGVMNGVKYYYAVVSYDRGDSLGIPPSECTMKVVVDPISGEEELDENVVSVIPGDRAIGYVGPEVSRFVDGVKFKHTSGRGTGRLEVEVLNDLEVRDMGYWIWFEGSGDSLRWNVVSDEERVDRVDFVDTVWKKLSGLPLASSVKVSSYQEGVDYVVDYNRGLIRALSGGGLIGKVVDVRYRFYAVKGSREIGGGDGSEVFDGMRLRVWNDALGLDLERSGWGGGSVGRIKYKITTATLGIGRRMYPADFVIRFGRLDTLSDGSLSSPVDTSVNGVRLPFYVENVTEGYRVKVYVREVVRNGRWDLGEDVMFLERGSTNRTTWQVYFERVKESVGDSVVEYVYPRIGIDLKEGDEFWVKTKRSFNTVEGGVTDVDSFRLEVKGYRYDPVLASNLLDRIKVVPNPYVGINELEPVSKLPGQVRGERRIYFDGLPRECVIRIYTLSGELVKEIYHSSGVDNSREYWNLLNRDGLGVSYGVYIAHIEAPGIGEKLIKFAIIK